MGAVSVSVAIGRSAGRPRFGGRLPQGDHDTVPADGERVASGIERRRALQSQLELSGALFSTLPDSRQHVLNRCARRWLGQHFTQTVLDFGRDQARAQKRRHALQLRHHETTRHAAALIQWHLARSAMVFLIQPTRHRDLAPQGHPLLVDHLLETVYPTVTNQGVGGDLTGLRQS